MDIQEIIDLLERIAEFLYQEAEGNCPYCGAKDYPVCKNKKGYDEVKPEDAEEWRIDHSETCIVVSIDQVLTFLKQQPKATSIGNKIREIASKDILGQTKLVRDKDILNQAANRLDAWWKYINELKEEVDLLKQQPKAGEWTKRLRVLLATQDRTAVVQEAYDLCGRLDRAEARLKELEVENGKLLDTLMAAGFIGQGTQIIGDKRYEELMVAEAINKDLLEACEKAFEESHNPKVEKVLKAAIAKANKEGGE